MLLDKRLASKDRCYLNEAHVMILKGLFTFCLVHQGFIAEIVCLVTLCWELPEVQGTNCERTKVCIMFRNESVALFSFRPLKEKH